MKNLNLEERKQALGKIVGDYSALLGRQKSKEYQERGKELQARLKGIQEDRYQIALIGFVNRGKSTLLNALLGDTANPIISPVSVKTCTGAVVRFLDSALYPDREGKKGAIVYYNNGKGSEEIDIETFPQYVSQIAEGFNENSAKSVDRVDVYGDFRLVKTQGIFVDTPGRGALYDQDYLSRDILQQVDLILCPLALDNLLSAEERAFLNDNLAPIKEKAVFLITKVDDEKDKDVLSNAVKKAGALIADLVGGKPPIFPVAAQRLVRANQGKPFDEDEDEPVVETPEVAKKNSGIEALTKHLEEQLKQRSSIDNKIKKFCYDLDEYLQHDKTTLQEKMVNLKTDAGLLEKKKEELEKDCKHIRTSFDKDVKKFKSDWGRVVTSFTLKLKAKEGEISRRLALKQTGIIDLIGYSSKMTRKIQAEIQAEFAPVLFDMGEKLTQITDDFAEKLKSDIIGSDIGLSGHSSAKNSGVKKEVVTWIGSSAAFGVGALGLTTAVSAISPIVAASGALATATTAATTTAATAGIISKIGSVFGAGQIAGTATVAGAAQGAFFTALIGGVVPILGGAAVAVAAYKIGKNFAQSQAEKSLPAMLETQLGQVIEAIEKNAISSLDSFLEQFGTHLESMLEKSQDELDEAISAIESLDADSFLAESDKKLQELDQITRNLRSLSNQL
ncbi:MAG: dynamin family protein [Spirochaetes bacterium]|nr:dynamin family protein [Spirochaetota bacterium]